MEGMIDYEDVGLICCRLASGETLDAAKMDLHVAPIKRNDRIPRVLKKDIIRSVEIPLSSVAF